jgi:DNA-binding transcriptional LysR family regulator
MEFRHLRYFLVLAEELHFGRAAQRLSISQPPLSLNIQQLEASVGAQLFNRNSRGVQLTAAGLAFVPAARALLAQASSAAREAREVAEGQSGQLLIGFAGTMLYCGLPQILRRFQASHPRLRLVLQEMSSSEQLSELLRDRLDVGFVHTPRVPPGFDQVLVSSQPLMACLPASHPLAGSRSLGIEALAGHDLVVVSRTVSPDYHERILQLCEQSGWMPTVVHELRHWLSVLSLVSQGLGVALVPQALQQSALAGVVLVPLQAVDVRYDTRCLWRSGRDQTALGDFVQAVQQGLAGADNPHFMGADPRV